MADHGQVVETQPGRRANITEQRPGKPRAGRPRQFTDEDVFNAAARVLGRAGYPSLTLAAIAEEVGCTRPALNRRFGDLRGLIDAFISWIAGGLDRTYARLHADFASPLATLRAGALRFSAGDSATLESRRYLEFFATGWNDPLLRPSMIALARQWEASAALLLTEAEAAGEIVAGHVEDIAHLLSTALTGAVVMQPEDRRHELSAELQRVLDTTIAPYLVPSRHP